MFPLQHSDFGLLNSDFCLRTSVYYFLESDVTATKI